jgi:uncharacterized protein (TIGR00725 family)
MSQPVVVAVIGGSDADADERAKAREVGRLLGGAGAIVVCGGRGGVMEAVCQGAREAGGLTVGILPGKDAADGNAYLSLALPTGLGEARNALVVLAGEVVIAIGGGSGTLSEIGLALQAGRRVLGLGTWKAFDPTGGAAAVEHVETAAEAVERALQGRSSRTDAGGSW